LPTTTRTLSKDTVTLNECVNLPNDSVTKNSCSTRSTLCYPLYLQHVTINNYQPTTLQLQHTINNNNFHHQQFVLLTVQKGEWCYIRIRIIGFVIVPLDYDFKSDASWHHAVYLSFSWCAILIPYGPQVFCILSISHVWKPHNIGDEDGISPLKLWSDGKYIRRIQQQGNNMDTVNACVY